MAPSRIASILIVDDNEVNRYVLERMLERSGFTVISAASGRDALQLARSRKPDLIVLDVHLPDISGLEVCQQLKADPEMAGVPVLHLSAAHILAEDKVAGLDSGADAYLTQPVDSRELLATINSLLRARRAEDALRRIQWLLYRSVRPDADPTNRRYCAHPRSAGDEQEMLLLDSVGDKVLAEIAGEYLDLLETSSAIYERNGRCALSIVSSGWCRMLDDASLDLRSADHASPAGHCGGLHCEGSCSYTGAMTAMREQRPVDMECEGGLRLYALPIIAGQEVVGAINVSYGDPPRGLQKMQEVAESYRVGLDALKAQAEAYESRPPFIVDVAKKRLHTAARLIGEIVERKRAERHLKKAKDEAEGANKAKDHFLAVLSHELRTPLTPVVTALSILRNRVDLDPEMREVVEMLQRNVELEALLIDDLLDVTRISRGKVELDRRPVALCDVIRGAVEVVGPDIEGQRLAFDFTTEGGPYIVEADPSRLQQVFWNLLKNAVKFTPAGGRVEVHCRREEQSAVVEVRDSGIGIEPEMLGRVFSAFEQAERTITRQFGGLGLGLTISRAMVELHGGSIEAQSEGKGKGATFRVRLPIVAAQPRVDRPRTVPLPPTRGLSILLVEDHRDTANIMQRLLTMDGHRVERAADVASALELAAREEFDLMISDLGLPDASGLELLRELRRRGHVFPAIALSGYGQEADLKASKEAGFADHLTKPTNAERLTHAVAAVVGREASRVESVAGHSGAIKNPRASGV